MGGRLGKVSKSRSDDRVCLDDKSLNGGGAEELTEAMDEQTMMETRYSQSVFSWASRNCDCNADMRSTRISAPSVASLLFSRENSFDQSHHITHRRVIFQEELRSRIYEIFRGLYQSRLTRVALDHSLYQTVQELGPTRGTCTSFLPNLPGVCGKQPGSVT